MNFLYSKGFTWIDSSYDINDAILFYHRNNYDKIFLARDKKFGFANDLDEIKCEEINFNLLLREDKLKRILKTKFSPKTK